MKKEKSTSIIIYLFKCVPLSWRRLFFRGLLRLFYHLSAKQRLITLHNLHRAYPEKDMAELVRIAKGVYRHLGLVAADFFEIPYITRDNVHEWVEFEGMEHIDETFAKGKGLLSIVAHFGNWEMMTVAFPMVRKPMNIVYRPLDSPVLENLTAWVRTLNGNTVIPKGGSGKTITRLLGENNALGILSDQNVSAREGVFVDFFGRPACTAVGLAVLAMRTGAPVIPAFMPRMPDGRYRFIIQEAVPIDDTGDYEKDLFTNTQRFTKVVEAMVRRYPDQWFWLHQRWKTKTCQKE
ncbi:MAG: lysophospholipid acyltransferase family protein [Deltaproteobacteria bacterium]|nr:lysophospholipid acyltransferase family protein [Deltaproteobacteria bacterium]